MTQTPSFRRSRDLDKSNKFGQMQELTNANYSEMKLCSIFRSEYKAIENSTNKKKLHSLPQYWNDEAAPANSGFVNKANWRVYNLLGVGSKGAVFTDESLIEHCQVVRSVNSAM